MTIKKYFEQSLAFSMKDHGELKKALGHVKHFQANQIVFAAGNTTGGRYHCTIDLQFDWFGISCMTTDIFCFYLQNRLIQISQTVGQWYSDSSPLVFPVCRWNPRTESARSGQIS
jgi:hypothetical protein